MSNIIQIGTIINESQKKTEKSFDNLSPAEQHYWKHIYMGQYTMATIADPKEAYEIIRTRANSVLNPKGARFGWDDDNKKLITDLCHYFTGNKSDLHLNKGIMLMGDPGRGKTFILKLFTANWGDNKYFENTFNWVITSKMAIVIRRDPQKAEEFYRCTSIENVLNRQNILLDELGGEIALAPTEIGKRGLTFAEVDQVGELVDILHTRHFLFNSYGVKTHITTNLTTGEQMEKLYTPKIVSRFNEMCNVIKVNGRDRRI